MWKEISKYGRKLVDQGLVEANFGNISILDPENPELMIITKSGVALDEIDADGVVKVDVAGPSEMDSIASSETVVHRLIYNTTPSRAILHAHCPYSVTQSMLCENDMIIPVDSEGKFFLKQIPVVRGDFGTEQLAENLSRALEYTRGAIAYSHGTFVTGKDLREAYILTAQIEHSCQIRYLYDIGKRESTD